MRGETRRKIEMAARVREFSRANPSTDQSHEDTVARLEERLARADALAVQQLSGTSEAQAAYTRRTKTRLQIEFALLNPLVKVGRLAAKLSPQLLGRFQLSRPKSTHKAFLIAARGMLADATSARDILVGQGLPTPLLDDLAAALDRFEGETEAINFNRRAHISARVELKEVAAHLTGLVGVLDGFNRYRFQQDPERLTVWNAVRRVAAHTPRKNPEPPAGPAPAGGETRAA